MSDLWPLMQDQYEIEEQSTAELGRGGGGVVRRCRGWNTGQLYAIKTACKSTEQEPQAIAELSALHKIAIAGGHPNIITLRDYIITEEPNGHIHTIMDLCTGGSLFDYLSARGHVRRRPAVSQSDTAHLMFALMSAVGFCHGLDIMHGDIKPENILFPESKSPLSAVKLTDFGISAVKVDGAFRRKPCLSRHGSVPVVAPEIIAGEAYNQSSDIWSLGVLMYFLLVGDYPFYGSSHADLRFNIMMTWPPDYGFVQADVEAKDMLSKMLCLDPLKRPTVKELLCHPWLQTFNGN